MNWQKKTKRVLHRDEHLSGSLQLECDDIIVSAAYWDAKCTVLVRLGTWIPTGFNTCW